MLCLAYMPAFYRLGAILLTLSVCACGDAGPSSEAPDAPTGGEDAGAYLGDATGGDGALADADPSTGSRNIAEVLGRPWSRTAPFEPNPEWKATCEAELPEAGRPSLPAMPGSVSNCAGNPALCGPSKDQDCRSEPARSSWLHRVTVDTTEFPSAVCNDGSPAIIEVRKGTGEGANKWLIWFKGGGGCGNQHFCAQRWCGSRGGQYTASIMSSDWNGDGVVDKAYCSRTETGSAFDSELVGNPFADANIVRIRYCSSDAHGGDAGDVPLLDESDDDSQDRPFTAHFRGHALAAAVVEMLKSGVESDDGAMTLASIDDASRVVIAGSSAGGGGAIHNMDFMHEQFRASNPEVVVRGIIDAVIDPAAHVLRDYGVFVDAALDQMATPGVDYASFRRENLMASWNGFRASINAFADQSCVAYHEANSPELMHGCLELPSLLSGSADGPHFIQTPIFLRRDLTDPTAGRHYGGCIDYSTGKPCYQPDHSALSYQQGAPASWLNHRDGSNHMGQTLQDILDAGSESAVSGIFAPTCGSHTGFINRAFSSQYAQNYIEGKGYSGPARNFVQTVAYWLENDSPVYVIDGSPDEADSSSLCAQP